jgi:MFS family permease
LVGEAAARPATWRSLLADREYRALWSAQAVSIAGDQLARVALTVLVYDQTGSALLTAAVYAITYIPWIVGGPLLGVLADRLPRRTIMIGCNLAAAVLIGAMAIPGMPLAALCVLLFLAVLLEPLFSSARSALIADVLPDDRYVLASALGNVTTQTGQVVGFAMGGIAVKALGAGPSLLIDASTFLLSGCLLALRVRRRPAATNGQQHDAGVAGWRAQLASGARMVFGDPRLRTLVILSWLASYYIVPEGLAGPYVTKEMGGGSLGIGLVLAAEPAGVVIGGLILSRLVPPARRLALMVPLAAVALCPLVLIGLRPSLQISIALLVVCGLGASYQLVANATFVQTVAPERRGQAYGQATAGLIAGQGLGVLAAGAVAEFAPPSAVIAGAGVLGLITLAAVSGAGRRVFASHPSPVVR